MTALLQGRSVPLKPLHPFSKPIFWTAFSITAREIYKKSHESKPYVGLTDIR